MTPGTSTEEVQPRPLIEKEIRRGLSTRQFGRLLHIYEQLDSTNTTALALAEQGLPEGTVVIALSQTKGRGRKGRAWVSPPDQNLYLSIILRPQEPANRFGLWTLAAALAVARSIHQFTALPARLKWPNDVMINKRKVAGLLLESAIHGERFKYVVMGIGVNVNLRPERLPDGIRNSATSMFEELGREIDRVEFLQSLLKNLEDQYNAFQTGQRQKILETYYSLSETIGETVAILGTDQEWIGKAIGITTGGELILRDQDQAERIIQSDDVIHVRNAHATGH